MVPSSSGQQLSHVIMYVNKDTRKMTTSNEAMIEANTFDANGLSGYDNIMHLAGSSELISAIHFKYNGFWGMEYILPPFTTLLIAIML